MYDINPNQANTQEYGINKGTAQVLNPDVAFKAEELGLQRQKMAQDEANRKAKEAEAKKAKQDEEIQKALEKSKGAHWFGVHTNEIDKSYNDLTDLAVKMASKGDLGVADWAQLYGKANELKAKQQNSLAREADYYRIVDNASKASPKNGNEGGFGNYLPSSVQELLDWSKKEHPLNEAPPPLAEKVNMAWHAQQLGKTNNAELDKNELLRLTPTETVLKQIDNVRVNTVLHASMLNEMSNMGEGDFNELKEFKGVDRSGKTVYGLPLSNDEEKIKTGKYAPATPEKVFGALHGEEIQIRKKDPAPQVREWQTRGAQERKNDINVTQTVDKNGNKSYTFDKKNADGTNILQSIPFGKNAYHVESVTVDGADINGNPIGGKAKIALTSEEKQASDSWDAYDKKIADIKKEADDEIEKVSSSAGLFTSKSETQKKIDKITSDAQAKMNKYKPSVPRPELNGKPIYDGQMVNLDANQTAIGLNVFGKNLPDVINQTAEGVNYSLFNTPKNENKNVSSQTKGKKFSEMNLSEKQSLQKQSGAKTQQEFINWLKDNGY